MNLFPKHQKPHSLIKTLCIATLLATNNATYCQTATQTNHLRIASYNIRHGEGMDEHLDYSRTAARLEKIAADVVAVQEVDSMTRRTNNTYSLGDIASRTGYVASFAPAISFDGGKYGIGILSRKRPLRTASYALPGREEARTLLVAEFDDYVFACTHLSLNDDDRMASLPTIERIADSYDKPFIIAGDWNSHPDSPFIKALSEKFKICSRKLPSYPADKPDECLDYIVVYTKHCHTTTRDAQVVEDTVTSDHRPIYADIELSATVKKMLPHEKSHIKNN